MWSGSWGFSEKFGSWEDVAKNRLLSRQYEATVHWEGVQSQFMLLFIRIFKVEKIVQPFSRPFITLESQKETG